MASSAAFVDGLFVKNTNINRHYFGPAFFRSCIFSTPDVTVTRASNRNVNVKTKGRIIVYVSFLVFGYAANLQQYKPARPTLGATEKKCAQYRLSM